MQPGSKPRSVLPDGWSCRDGDVRRTLDRSTLSTEWRRLRHLRPPAEHGGARNAPLAGGEHRQCSRCRNIPRNHRDSCAARPAARPSPWTSRPWRQHPPHPAPQAETGFRTTRKRPLSTAEEAAPGSGSPKRSIAPDLAGSPHSSGTLGPRDDVIHHGSDR